MNMQGADTMKPSALAELDAAFRRETARARTAGTLRILGRLRAEADRRLAIAQRAGDAAAVARIAIEMQMRVKGGRA